MTKATFYEARLVHKPTGTTVKVRFGDDHRLSAADGFGPNLNFEMERGRLERAIFNDDASLYALQGVGLMQK